jgi:hypothetical protein
MPDDMNSLNTDLNSAQEDWNTLADIIGKKYNDAYQKHSDVLDGIKRVRQAEIDRYYFVLGLVCTAVTGGVAAGLMAPWVKDAGPAAAKEFAKRVFSDVAARNATATVTRQMAQGIVGRIVAPSGEAGGGAFTPQVPNPLSFYLGMKTQLGICFAEFRKQLGELSDHFKHRNDAFLVEVVKKNCPLFTDRPSPANLSQMAGSIDMYNAIEASMWIAWANVRDMDYWNTAYDRIEAGDGNQYKIMDAIIDAQHLDPILERFNEMLLGHRVSMAVNGERILDIRKLRKLNLSVLHTFRGMPAGSFAGFSNMSAAVQSLADARTKKFRPLYKR